MTTLINNTNNPEYIDPILPLYHRWMECRLNYIESFDDSYTIEENELVKAMINLRPTTIEGIAAFAHVAFDLMAPVVLGELSHEQRVNDPKSALVAAIWSATTSSKNDLPPNPKLD